MRSTLSKDLNKDSATHPGNSVEEVSRSPVPKPKPVWFRWHAITLYKVLKNSTLVIRTLFHLERSWTPNVSDLSKWNGDQSKPGLIERPAGRQRNGENVWPKDLGLQLGNWKRSKVIRNPHGFLQMFNKQWYDFTWVYMFNLPAPSGPSNSWPVNGTLPHPHGAGNMNIARYHCSFGDMPSRIHAKECETLQTKYSMWCPKFPFKKRNYIILYCIWIPFWLPTWLGKYSGPIDCLGNDSSGCWKWFFSVFCLESAGESRSKSAMQWIQSYWGWPCMMGWLNKRTRRDDVINSSYQNLGCFDVPFSVDSWL